ncbi:MAG: hypothetical protein JF887_06935 [Candidatus Dormibacteraeota bacterium]|uniref:DUF948 domain-containing protein n=1 Tax=Candidatus Amunia macphersoniae TaxID=3127014 RepID=A0A934KQ42_9BACT|nr:hypothetical protein [Candidatus Dormibacteraeota bacterium]
MSLDSWDSVLTIVSMVVASILAIVLAVTLVLTAAALGRVRRAAAQLPGGLEAAADNTASLPDQIPTINSALTAIQDGLDSVDTSVLGIARAYGLVR